jgi:hypothetical protein
LRTIITPRAVVSTAGPTRVNRVKAFEQQAAVSWTRHARTPAHWVRLRGATEMQSTGRSLSTHPRCCGSNRAEERHHWEVCNINPRIRHPLVLTGLVAGLAALDLILRRSGS